MQTVFLQATVWRDLKRFDWWIVLNIQPLFLYMLRFLVLLFGLFFNLCEFQGTQASTDTCTLLFQTSAQGSLSSFFSTAFDHISQSLSGWSLASCNSKYGRWSLASVVLLILFCLSFDLFRVYSVTLFGLILSVHSVSCAGCLLFPWWYMWC